MKKSFSQSREVNKYAIQRRRISIDSRSLEKRCTRFSQPDYYATTVHAYQKSFIFTELLTS